MTVDLHVAATYDALAPVYERVLVPLFRPMAKRMLQLVDLRPGWQVLDAGTGTGLVALLAAPRVGKGGRVVGIDASEEMLALARQKAERFGFSQCEFQTGDLNALDFPDATFNACLSQFSLHHAGMERALPEMTRVLAPGGLLVIQEWAGESSQLHQAVYDLLTRYRAAEPDERLAAMRANSARTHDFRQKFGGREAMQQAVAAAGLRVTESFEEHYPVRVGSADAFIDIVTVSPLMHAELAAMPEEQRAAFHRDAQAALQPLQTANGLEWTYHAVIVVGHR